MAQQAAHHERQKAAVAFLQDLLNNHAGRSTEDIAFSIARLAYDDQNPLRDLFLHANVPLRPASPTQSFKSRNSTKLLNLPQRGPKSSSSESKTPTPSQQALRQKQGSNGLTGKDSHHDRTSSDSKRDAAQAEHVQPGKAKPETPYKCIICSEDMSYKGVCKRHLDEQHVSPNIFQCERCGQCFGTKADAKVHCNSYGKGKCHWNVVKPASKVIYASEYTDEWFTSKTTYLEHLLKLSKHGSLRPQPSLHRKLRTLLGHPSLREDVVDMSEITHGFGEAWKKLRYSDTQLRRAIKQLEDAAIVDEGGSITFNGGVDSTHHALNIRHFLHTLLNGGALREEPRSEDGRTSRSTTIRRGPSPIVMSSYAPQVPSPAHAQHTMPSASRAGSVAGSVASRTTTATAATARKVRIKRHLSDLSNSTEPSRQPPGPQPLSTSFQYPLDPTQSQSMPENKLLGILPTALAGKPPEENVYLQHAIQDTIGETPTYGLMNVAHMQPKEGDNSNNAMMSMTPFPQLPDQQLHPQAPTTDDFWPSVHNPNFHFELRDSGLMGQEYQYPSDVSTRTSSIDTDRMTYVDSSEDEQNMADYQPYLQHHQPHPQQVGVPGMMGTFLLDEDDYSDMPMLYQQMSGL